MGWVDARACHEGYLLRVFADGACGRGWVSGGIPVDGADGSRLVDGQGQPTVMRPEAAVIGWQIGCEHVPAQVGDEDLAGFWGHKDFWKSSTFWRRVYRRDQEDLTARLVYAPLDVHGSTDLDKRPELHDLLLAQWQEHLEPEDHARSIRSALDGVITAKELLELEVAAAHADGMSWADIGRVAGISRQGARDRWASP